MTSLSFRETPLRAEPGLAQDRAPPRESGLEAVSLLRLSLSARGDCARSAVIGGASASGSAESSQEPDSSVGYVRYVGARPDYPRSVPSTPEDESMGVIDDSAIQGPIARQGEARGQPRAGPASPAQLRPRLRPTLRTAPPGTDARLRAGASPAMHEGLTAR